MIIDANVYARVLCREPAQDMEFVLLNNSSHTVVYVVYVSACLVFLTKHCIAAFEKNSCMPHVHECPQSQAYYCFPLSFVASSSVGYYDDVIVP